MGRSILYEYTLLPKFSPKQIVYCAFIKANLHVLEKFPHLIHQRAINTYQVHMDAVTLTSSDVLPWLPESQTLKLVKYLNKPTGTEPCSMIIDSPTRVTTIEYSQMDTHIITLTTSGSVLLWQAKTGKLMHTLDVDTRVLSVCTQQETKDTVRFYAAGSDGVVYVRDVTMVTVANSDDVMETAVYSWLAYSPTIFMVTACINKSTFVTAALKHKGSKTEEIKLWSLEEVERQYNLVAIVPKQQDQNAKDQNEVAMETKKTSEDKNGVISKEMHDVIDPQAIKEIAPTDASASCNICQVLLSPDGIHLAVILGQSTGNTPKVGRNMITLYEVKTLDPVWIFTEEIAAPKSAVIFKKPKWGGDNVWYMLVTTFKTLYLLHIDTTKEDRMGLCTMQIHTKDAICYATPLTKKDIILCGMYNDIMVWDLSQDALKRPSEGISTNRLTYRVDDIFDNKENEGALKKYGFLRGHNRSIKGKC